MVHVAPPGEAVTVKEAGSPPELELPVTLTVAWPLEAVAVGVCGVAGASPAAPKTHLVYFPLVSVA